MGLLLLLLLTTSVQATQKTPSPLKCDPCKLGEGYCVDGKVKFVCFVDSTKVCGDQWKKSLYALQLPPKEGACSCEGTGLTKVSCIMP